MRRLLIYPSIHQLSYGRLLNYGPILRALVDYRCDQDGPINPDQTTAVGGVRYVIGYLGPTAQASQLYCRVADIMGEQILGPGYNYHKEAECNAIEKSNQKGWSAARIDEQRRGMVSSVVCFTGKRCSL